MVFEPFWCENGYRLCPFWSEFGYGFRDNYLNYGSVWTSFWSEIGSGFWEPGGTPPSRISMSTPQVVKLTIITESYFNWCFSYQITVRLTTNSRQPSAYFVEGNLERLSGYTRSHSNTGRIFDWLKYLSGHFVQTEPFDIFALFTWTWQTRWNF